MLNYRSPSYNVSLFGFICLAFLGACKNQSITSTWVPKNIAPPSTINNPDVSTPEAPSLTWSVPNNWKEVPPSSMRVASFLFEQAPSTTLDISVVKLAGDGGGVLANVNRWRGQLKLTEISDEQLKKDAVTWTVDHHPMIVVDYTGADDLRMIAAIYTLDQDSWYFKMTGKTNIVDDAKPSFTEFVKSIQTHHVH